MDIPGLSFLLSMSQPWSQLFLQEALVPFIGAWYLETKIWVLGDTAYF